VLEQGFEESFPVGEVVIKGTLRHVEAGAHGINGQGLNAVLTEGRQTLFEPIRKAVSHDDCTPFKTYHTVWYGVKGPNYPERFLISG
jgi:hypothetical protein